MVLRAGFWFWLLQFLIFAYFLFSMADLLVSSYNRKRKKEDILAYRLKISNNKFIKNKISACKYNEQPQFLELLKL